VKALPGCDRPVHWCEAHHVWAWEDGGPTRLDNLVLLCSRHHHLAHKPGWTLKLLVDNNAEVIATTPDGLVLRSHPTP
jgi:predicted restriction endonuclease